MTTQYSPILKLALPVQGELSGTWGDVVNDNITSMVEQAIAGRAVINTWSTNSHSLTSANGTTSESRCAMLELTDTGTALSGAGTVICPALSKIYIVKNAAGQNITVKTASGTGVLIPDGRTTFLFCDGTNVVEALTHTTSLQLGTSTTVTAVLDEDNMVSDSPTSLATQQSIKAYVDSKVGQFDSLAEVLAVGNTTGSNNIIVDNGQKITTNTIDETTAGSGVTIDSVLLKDDVVNATDVETGSISANDGTAAATIANSTGVITVPSAVLTTADINGGTADGVVIGGSTPAAATVTTATANTSLNIAGTVTVTSILDEDNMASDDPAGLATQQSIKAYVDSQVGTVDTLAEVLANGNTTGGTNIQMTTTDELQFRDTGLKISSSADGQLDIDSDGTIDINATTSIAFDTDTLFVDSTNDRVGINTASPAFPLDLSTNSSTTNDAVTALRLSVNTTGTAANNFGATINFSGEDASGSLRDLSTINAIYTDATNRSSALTFKTRENLGTLTEALRIDQSQRVLIGTTSTRSTYKHTVANTSAVSRILGIANGGVDALHFDQARGSVASPTASNADGDGNYISFSSYDGTNWDDIGSVAVLTDGAQNAGRMIFRTTPTGSSQTERMRLNSNGHLAVGFKATIGGGQSTTSPDAVFTVQDSGADVGKITAVFGADENTNTYTDNTNKEARVGIPHYDTDEEPAALFFASTTSSVNQIVFGGGTSRLNAATDIAFRTAANTTTATGTEAMRIDSSQRVLIGHSTSIPNGGDNQQLQVTGTGSSDGISLARFNTTYGAYFTIGRSGSGTIGTYTAVPINDEIGRIQWAVADGTDMSSVGAMINAATEQQAASNDVPTRLMFSTTSDGAASPTERMRIRSTGDVGIGTGGDFTVNDITGSGYGLVIGGSGASSAGIQIRTGPTGAGNIYFGDNSGSDAGRYDGFIQYSQNARQFNIGTARETAVVIDSSQRILIGGNSSVPMGDTNHQVQLQGDNFAKTSNVIQRYGESTAGGMFAFAKSRNATIGSQTIVQNDDQLGKIRWYGSNGSNFTYYAAEVSASVDGAPSNSADMPGRIVFSTTTDGAGSPSERMRISSNGFVNIGGARTADESLVELNKSGSNTVGEGHIGFAGGADPLFAIRFDNSDFNFRLDRSYGGWTSTSALSVRRSNGYVGLGVDTASYPLDVQNSASTYSRVLATGNNTRAAFLAQAHLSDGTDINMNVGVYGDANQGEISMSTGHPLLLYTNNDPNKGIEIQVDGDLNIKDGNLVVASGHGIDFSATAGTGTSELLDDYEEGTWNVTDSSGANLTLTVSNNAYTKVGRFVMASAQVTWPTTSNTALVRLSVPFTSIAAGSEVGGMVNEQNYDGSVALSACLNTTTQVFFRINGLTALRNNQLSGKKLRFAVVYHAA